MHGSAGNPNRPSRWWHIAGVGLLVAVPLSPFLLGDGGALHDLVVRSSPVPFDADAWGSDAKQLLSEPLRYRMAKHMASSGELLGKTEAEIHGMLDSPENPGTRRGDDTLVYAVKEMGGSDCVYLRIVFDPERRVTRVLGPGEN